MVLSYEEKISDMETFDAKCSGYIPGTCRLRKDLVKERVNPPIIGVVRGEIDWENEVFDYDSPDEIENEEFNLILMGDRFKYGIAFANSIDFDYE